MRTPDDYAVSAENALDEAGMQIDPDHWAYWLARAQVYATLAVASASEGEAAYHGRL